MIVYNLLVDTKARINMERYFIIFQINNKPVVINLEIKERSILKIIIKLQSKV